MSQKRAVLTEQLDELERLYEAFDIAMTREMKWKAIASTFLLIGGLIPMGIRLDYLDRTAGVVVLVVAIACVLSLAEMLRNGFVMRRLAERIAARATATRLLANEISIEGR